MPDQDHLEWRRATCLLVIVSILACIVTVAGLTVSRGRLTEWVSSLGAPPPIAPAREDETLILVATFRRAEGVDDSKPHEAIRRAIESAAAELNLPEVRVAVERSVLGAEQRAEAEQLGDRYNASLVIWGDDAGVRVSVNYLNLRELDFPTGDGQREANAGTALSNPSASASFSTDDLPSQLPFLALFAIGHAYTFAGAYEEAIDALERAVEALPPEGQQPDGVAQAYFLLGWLRQVSSGELELAVTAYSSAIRRKPDHADAYYNRGVAHHALGDLDAALGDYNRAIELDPDNPDTYYNRGNVHYDQGNLDAALADYNKVIELNPDFPDAYINRGNVYRDRGDLEAALADYNTAVELEPDYAVAYYSRGLVHYDRGDLDAALAEFDRAIELDPYDPDAYYHRGLVRFRLGERRGRWATDFHKALELAPDTPAILDALCRGYALNQEPDLALLYCQPAVDGAAPEERPWFRDSRGIAYAQLGDYEAAIEEFEAFVAWAEQQPEADLDDRIARRQEWIEALQTGENPFTPELLNELRTE